MINAIKYYYNISVSELKFIHNNYFFDNYILKPYYKSIDIELYNLLISNNYYLHQIVYNKDNNYITLIDEKPYVLLKIIKNDCISLELIKNYNITFNNKKNPGWDILWENKIDYYEKNISNIKDDKIFESFNYYVGMTENAIKLYKLLNLNNNYCLCHIRFENDFEFYDPFNIIIDYKMRDIAEYIKNEFYQKNKLYYKHIDEIVYKNKYNDVMLFFVRMIYPSIYFDQYDNYMKNEKIDYSFYLKKELYIEYLKYIYRVIQNKYQIPIIEWLK